MARPYSLWLWAVFAISTSWVSDRGLMKFLLQLLGVAAVLVPDFLTLGLVGPAFFSAYCIVRALGFAHALDKDLVLEILLAPAYLVTIALNTLIALRTPARSGLTTSIQSKSKTKPSRCESSQGTRNAEPVAHGGALIES